MSVGVRRVSGFDGGLGVQAADVRRWVASGPAVKAQTWTPAAVTAPPVLLKANGMPRVVPTRPYGDRLACPYSILDEGASSRRSFWTVQTAPVQRFNERYEQIRRPEPLWTTELSMSKSGTANPVRDWQPRQHLVVMGQWRQEIDHRVSRQPHLVSVARSGGSLVAHNLGLEPTDPRDPTKVPPRTGAGGGAGK